MWDLIGVSSEAIEEEENRVFAYHVEKQYSYHRKMRSE